MMNKWLGIGRITADLELRYNTSNTAYTRFNLAVNRKFTNENGERQADFISCVAWRERAEMMCKYLKKGSLIAIEGRIQTGSYDDKDGQKRFTTDVVADSVQFLESKSQSQNRSASSYSSPMDNVSPYDYQSSGTSGVSVENDPFADFGDSVSIDDNFLD